MPVPQMRDTDEETNQPPAKKPRHSSLNPEIMSTRCGSSTPLHQTHSQRSLEENGSECVSPIASLANLGNTCFLNSVLYTLRFAPCFVHKVHHLYTDSVSLTKQLNAAKQDRACSLGRNLGKTGTWGNKEAYSNVSNDSDMKTQAFITNLHNLYASLWSNEYKDHNMEPIQPLNFLHALREVNPIFLGNRQHDAHELLVCIVDAIHEACKIVYPQNSGVDKHPLRCPSPSSGDVHRYGDPSQETIFEDFQGVSLHRTRCLECEDVTERKELCCDICVPIVPELENDEDYSVDRLYQSAIVTEEYLVDCNKYWCAKCLRYNEARSSVRFERIPKLLTLHLKRFSGFGASLSKVNDYMPTPFTLSCFCETCLEAEQRNEKPPHKYYLYAVIMHLGASIASGHYVAYVKMLENSQDYLHCVKSKTSSLSRGYSINSMSQGTTNNSHMTQEKPKSILRYFTKLSSKSFSNGSNSSSSKDSDLRKERLKQTCKGADCCSVKLRTNASWLECDDAHIKPISIREIEHMLAKSNSNSGVTPYLLFYTKA